MLHLKSCNEKHNSESVFRYFASAVIVTKVQNVIENIIMLSVVIQDVATKKWEIIYLSHKNEITKLPDFFSIIP